MELSRILSPSQVQHLTPGTHVLLRAKFKGVNSASALAQVTVSNKPVSIRVSDVVAEILPKSEPDAAPVTGKENLSAEELPLGGSKPDETPMSPSATDTSEAEQNFAEPPVPVTDDPRAAQVLNDALADVDGALVDAARPITENFRQRLREPDNFSDSKLIGDKEEVSNEGSSGEQPPDSSGGNVPTESLPGRSGGAEDGAEESSPESDQSTPTGT